MPDRARLALLLALATPALARPSDVLVCRGHEPEWSLRIDGPSATLAALGADGLARTGFAGRLQSAEWARPSFLVYRGRAGASGSDLVAVITREACVDTMADAAEGGGPADHTARVSMPDGAVRLGCCTASPAPALPVEPPPPPAASADASAVSPSPSPATATVAGSPPVAGGEITALTLPDGTVCRSAGMGATIAFEGRRLNFDCGLSGVDRTGLVGGLAGGPGDLLTAQRAEITWNEGLASIRRVEPVGARVSEIALADGLACRHAGKGATLAFEGRRASYTCGMKDGDTVALLGDLEPAEGGFRIVRARVAHGENGFVLRSAVAILVTAPR